MPTPLPDELAQQLRGAFRTLMDTLALLEAEEIEGARLAGGWTPKALVAHVGFWDRVQTQRMQDALSGASAQRGFVRPTTENDARAAEDEDRPLGEVVVDAMAAREALAAFAATLSPAELEREYPEGDRPFSLLNQLQHMVGHTRIHTRELNDYCGSMRRWQRGALRTFLVRQHNNLMESIAGLHEDTLVAVRVCDKWTIRDLLAHLLSWNEFGYLVLKGWPQADRTTLAPWLAAGESDDIDAINARLLAARAGLDMIAIADGLATCHRRMLRIFDRAGDETLAGEGDYGWGEQGEMARFFYSLAQHDMEHAEAIWRYRTDPQAFVVQ
jgi:uncharacterized damage-inducible protein DinB